MKKNTGSFYKQKKKSIWFFSPVLLILILDQLTKFLIRNNFSLGESIVWMKGFSLTYVQNTGAGFGLLKGMGFFLIVISLLVIIIILDNYRKFNMKDKMLFFSTAILLGGVIGNLMDRLFFGFVTDFISFSFWPAFNVADTAISIGVIGLIIYFWKK